MPEITPMMQQYLRIKEQHKDCILFFRLGDFYEMFNEDAHLASRELDLTLTTRDRNKDADEQVPMCGVPYHSSEAYIARLIAKGYKVAICEQTEDPALAKGLVDREVIRVITPGTVIDASMLDEGKPNYICAVYADEFGIAACFADISTGEICVRAFREDAEEHICNALSCYLPTEVVLSPGAGENPALTQFLTERLNCMAQVTESGFEYMESAIRVCAQFQAEDVDALGLGDEQTAVRAVGGLLAYLAETQKTDLSQINHLDVYAEGRYMELDLQTVRNLELTMSLRSGEKKGSLLWVLDKTRTPMGSRMLRAWLSRPLLSPAPIQRRQAAVAELAAETVIRGELMQILRNVGDMERLIGKIAYGTANARDLAALAASASRLPALTAQLAGVQSAMLTELAGTDTLTDVCADVDRAIADNPPFSVREGGMIRPGYDPEVDRLRNLLDNSTGVMAEIEARERERTGKKLKVSYNKIFGYYIEIPRSMSEAVPDDYIRKQTLVNSERFITPELKDLENTLLTAKDRLADLEYDLFTRLRERVAGDVARIQAAAEATATLDVLCALAETAVQNNYCRPEIDVSSVLEIRDGRHPVVEKMQTDALFVANDTYLDGDEARTAIITGPNMAGKSTYMRQNALIVLMAQIGSFVPARSARIGIVDRVFTRIGASDDLSGGRSTFMVEMTEVAEILKNATPRSLLILDEIGRGTSTYDGMAIARAVLEHCADKKKLGAKTLFATHYHELTELENTVPGVKNYNISAKKRGGDLIFLRKIVPGSADESYGIEVANLAGLPGAVIRRAKEVLSALDGGEPVKVRGASKTPPSEQISLLDMASDEVSSRLRAANLETMTPIEAMNLLYELKKLL